MAPPIALCELAVIISNWLWYKLQKLDMAAFETTMYLSTTSLGQADFASKENSAALDIFFAPSSCIDVVRHGRGPSFV
jgi:hypothetical protein